MKLLSFLTFPLYAPPSLPSPSPSLPSPSPPSPSPSLPSPHLLHCKDVVVEVLLKLFVGQIDAKLFKIIVDKNLESKDVQNACSELRLMLNHIHIRTYWIHTYPCQTLTHRFLPSHTSTNLHHIHTTLTTYTQPSPMCRYPSFSGGSKTTLMW